MRFGLVAFGLICLGAALVGCSKAESAPRPGATAGVPPPETPKDPSEALYEQLRSGAYQINAAMDAMERALRDCREASIGLGKGSKNAAADVVDVLDSAGSTIGDYLNAPELDEVRNDFTTNDERRLKAIEDLNDARREVLEGQGIADPMASDDPDPKVRAIFDRIAEDITEVIEAIEGAIEALGGSVIEPSEE